MSEDALRKDLISFLRSEASELVLTNGSIFTRLQAQEQLQQLVPAYIELRGTCKGKHGIVAAAPHVSFDHWSEYFCNRAATRFSLGWVVAKHYRDQDNLHIPVAIGRHLHVNRPTESDHPGGKERVSERARAVYDEYVGAVAEAAGRSLPIDLLIEFHSHRQTPHVEIATARITENVVRDLWDCWEDLRIKTPGTPEMRIEPLHELRLSATAAKRSGSLSPEICQQALHIEIPRGIRKSDELRQLANGQLLAFLDFALKRLFTD